jgi:hypothetical protein
LSESPYPSNHDFLNIFVDPKYSFARSAPRYVSLPNQSPVFFEKIIKILNTFLILKKLYENGLE